jgi:SAM-dependent methyltransferase
VQGGSLRDVKQTMTPTDWAELWRELACSDIQASLAGEAQMLERWRRVARQLDAGERSLADPLLDFLLGRLTPEMTVLDIGAGIGRWTLPMAAAVRRVTAVEPLAGMRQVLTERAASRGIGNLEVVDVPWLEAHVPLHDVAVAAHATYTSGDLVAFVRKMDAHARRACYLALRVPSHDGIIGELSQRLHGRWHDSPNFIVGYNLLLASGFYPNVLMEPGPARCWTDATLEEAMARARRHLRLEDGRHDSTIREVLCRRLRFADGAYRWPDGMRSALIWWDKGCL